MIRLKNILQEDNGMKPLNKSAATQLPAIIDRKKSMEEFETCIKAYGFHFDSLEIDKNNSKQVGHIWSRKAIEDVSPEMAIAILETTHEYVIGTKKWDIWDVWDYFGINAKAEPNFIHRGKWEKNGCKNLKSNIDKLAKKETADIWPSLTKGLNNKS